MQRQTQWGAICLLLTLSFFPAQFAAQLASPDHDIFRYDISLLGISSCQAFYVATSGSNDPVCSPLHRVFNLGIILHGMLTIAGIWLTRHNWPKDKLASSGLLLLALGGVGAMVVGAYPLDTDLLIHVVGAVMAIAAPGLGMLLLSKSLKKSQPTVAYWTAFVGVLVLLGGLGHALGGMPFGRGTMERLAVWPQTLWFAGIGLMFLSTQRKPAHRNLRDPVAAWR